MSNDESDMVAPLEEHGVARDPGAAVCAMPDGALPLFRLADVEAPAPLIEQADPALAGLFVDVVVPALAGRRSGEQQALASRDPVQEVAHVLRLDVLGHLYGHAEVEVEET